MKKAIVGIIVIAIICITGFYSYSYVTARNNFTIKELQNYGSGEELLWTDNSKYNKYDISFGTLNGTNTHEIDSKKSAYNMKINSSIQSGDFNLKIYNDSKVLFQQNGSTNKTISIDKNDTKNVKVEITGKKAKGHVVINLS